MSHRDNETIRMSDFSPISEKSKYYKVEEHEIPAQSKTFAAACFAFRDNLTRVQKSKARGTAVESESESDTSGTEDAYQQEASQAAKLTTYICYERTKNVAGAWPTTPNLTPTLLLMGVGLGALFVDICVLVTYLAPGKIAARAERLAGQMLHIITTVKGLAYVVGATACRSTYSAGQPDGGSDLWSWSCSAKADAMSSVNMSRFNCTADTNAWAFAITQVVLEASNSLINMYATRNDKCAKCADEGAKKSDEKPLLGRGERLDTLEEDTHGKLDELTPDMSDNLPRF